MFYSNWFQRNGRLRVCWGERIVIGPDTHFFAASIFFLTVGWILFVCYTNVILSVRVLAFIFGALSLSLLLATGLCNPGICPRHNYICNTENVYLHENNEVEMQTENERNENISNSARPFPTETSLGVHSDVYIAQNIEHSTAITAQTSNLFNKNNNKNSNDTNVINANYHNRFENSNVINDQFSNTGIYETSAANNNEIHNKNENREQFIVDGINDKEHTICNFDNTIKKDAEDERECRVVNYHIGENNEEIHESTPSSLLLSNTNTNNTNGDGNNNTSQVNEYDMHCSNQVFEGMRCIESYVNNNNTANKCNSFIPNMITHDNAINANINVNYDDTHTTTTTTLVNRSNNIANSDHSSNSNDNSITENKIRIINDHNKRRSKVHVQHNNSRWWRVVFRTWNGTLQHASVEQRWCYSCNSYRPLRAVHCRFCDVCIHRWDHHCPWTGTCIGGKNYVVYFSLLWVLLLFLVIAFFGGVVSLASRIVKLKETHSADPSISYTYYVINGLLETYLIELVLILLSLVWLTLVGTLACYHTYLITKNLTSSEDAKRLTENIYNQGSCWRNILHSLCYNEQNDDLLSQSTATCVSLSSTTATSSEYTNELPQSVHSTNINIDSNNNNKSSNNNSNSNVNANIYTTNTIVV